MRNRKTQYGWMALGGLLCLFGVVLACKLRDSNKAVAHDGVAANAAGNGVPVMPLPAIVPAPVAEETSAPLPPPGNMQPPVEDKSQLPEPLSGPLAPPLPLAPPVTRLGPPAQEMAPQSVPPAPSPNPGAMPVNPPSPPLVQPPVSMQPTVPVQNPIIVPARGDLRSEPGEPPLAPAPGPVQMYQVRCNAETLPDIARRTLGDSNRWIDIHKLNPNLKADAILSVGSVIRLPADACIPTEEVEDVKPLPNLRANQGPSRPKVILPLTGTFPCNLDDRKSLVLPKAIRDQLGGCDTVLVSPGTDHCLWVTNQMHLERLAKRLDSAPVHEQVVRDFKRLYFAQTEKVGVGPDGRIAVPDKLAQFAGLHQEVVLVGIDDHFELWDVARWRQYTQQKSAAARSAMGEE